MSISWGRNSISIVRDVSGYPVPYNPGKVGWSYPGRLWSPPTAISDLSSTILSVFRRLIVVVVGLGYDHVGVRFDIDGSGTCVRGVGDALQSADRDSRSFEDLLGVLRNRYGLPGAILIDIDRY
ncbi:hypothetical protein EJ04DRAFT_524352 [Polyplosphaeria fusca]|uniref:Uncharacterized protein n=1 Tax=Polyplosphaeria fusca TaxID=682080 RepID=A0A9P4QYR1_9PLEO|nr:hypothetical protein EJ04DRAFT_524352 [Polyplosphaeria fusca]